MATDFTEETAADAMIESFHATPDPRLREIMTFLTRHLHAFVRDIRPSSTSARVTGTTPLQWLPTQRIRRARETTDDSVDTIASAAGMGTAATLRRHFHCTIGVPPDDYRRTFRG